MPNQGSSGKPMKFDGAAEVAEQGDSARMISDYFGHFRAYEQDPALRGGCLNFLLSEF